MSKSRNIFTKGEKKDSQKLTQCKDPRNIYSEHKRVVGLEGFPLKQGCQATLARDNFFKFL